jgi:hypothetical protein
MVVRDKTEIRIPKTCFIFALLKEKRQISMAYVCQLAGTAVILFSTHYKTTKTLQRFLV